MSLSYPSRIGDQVPASSEARDNLSKLLRVDPRGGKDQVATKVALQYFHRSRELGPGYFDGVTSWAKSNVVYALAATAGVGAIALTAYAAANTTSGRWILGASLGTAVVSYAIGFKPEEYIKTLLTLAVRDTAVRAADSSIKRDERISLANAKEAKECHKEILNQLSAVYNDCAKELKKFAMTSSKNASERLELKKTADRLEERLPAIERLLSGLDLGKHEVEGVLQRFKDAIRFVQDQAGRLYPEKGYEMMNAHLLAEWPQGSVEDIVVPHAIRDRASAAHNSRMGFFDKAAGYGSAALKGVGTFAGWAAFTVLFAGATHAFLHGTAATTAKAQELFTKLANQNYRGLAEGIGEKTLLSFGIGAFGTVAWTAKITANNWTDHSSAIEENAQFVESELTACSEDLRAIYDGVADHLRTVPTNRAFLRHTLRQRLPAIHEGVARLGLNDDPSDILKNLEETFRF
jgi:hypothetical protein